MDHVADVNIRVGKYVDVEYIGDPPILDDVTKFKIQTGEIPASAAAVLRGAEAQLSVVLTGVTKRIVDPEYFGTSEQYVFGPFTFTITMPEDDAEKICGSSSGYQFRIKGSDDAPQIIRPALNMVLVSEVEGSLKDIYA
jgi:hypothetical protein